MPNQPKTPGRSVRIPGPLWDATKTKAAKRGETATDVVIRALNEYTGDEESTVEPLNLHEWTSCEVHGHQYEDGRCTDCGEKQEGDEETKP